MTEKLMTMEECVEEIAREYAQELAQERAQELAQERAQELAQEYAAEAREEARKEIIVNLYKSGISLSAISKATKIPLKQLRQMVAQKAGQ